MMSLAYDRSAACYNAGLVTNCCALVLWIPMRNHGSFVRFFVRRPRFSSYPFRSSAMVVVVFGSIVVTSALAHSNSPLSIRLSFRIEELA